MIGRTSIWDTSRSRLGLLEHRRWRIFRIDAVIQILLSERFFSSFFPKYSSFIVLAQEFLDAIICIELHLGW